MTTPPPDATTGGIPAVAPGPSPGLSLAARTWPEAEGLRTVIVPVGSCEQHGPHLPLDTDTRIAVAVARGAARHLTGAVVAPAVAIGASGEHADFPGTLSIGRAALTGVAVELGRSATATAPLLVFCNGHGGNVEALTRAVDVLRGEGRSVVLHGPTFTDGDAHAGRTETSLMLALAPDAVRLDRLEAGVVAPLADLWPRLRRDGVRAVSPNGVLGDPRGATADEGRRLLEESVRGLVAACASLGA